MTTIWQGRNCSTQSLAIIAVVGLKMEMSREQFRMTIHDDKCAMYKIDNMLFLYKK